MMSNWEKYSRLGLSVASTASSVGFSAAKMGTSIGFGIARGVTSAAVGVVGYPFGVGALLGGAVSGAFSLVEQVALAPILLGETLMSTTLVAAESSIDVLSAIFPGSDEASFSLASFVSLVKREWNEPSYRSQLPSERYSVAEIALALVAWGALQGVTHEWKEINWFHILKEINVNDIEDSNSNSDVMGIRERSESRIRITSDMTRRNLGQIITAEIEDVEPTSDRVIRPRGTSSRSHSFVSQNRLKSNLRRLSKMVLAGYGGAGLLFFGVSLNPPDPPPNPTVSNPRHTNANTPEEHLLADTVDAAEREASSTSRYPAPAPESLPKYSWWNVLLGRHDRDIFEGYAFTPATVRESSNRRRKRGSKIQKKPATVVVGAERHMPRFWVLTDHGRRQVVLVLRGTMSLNELAVDLTCDPAPFSPASPDDSLEDVLEGDQKNDEDNPTVSMPGSLPFPTIRVPPKGTRKRTESITSNEGSERETYNVHGGMLRMAQVMGAKGKPVHCAVQEALYKNKGYELVLTGHSLGAGVAALLALLQTWANPETCLTVLSSGLPVGRRVSAYCFAPPCLVSPALSDLSQRLITSFTHSHDVVSRLSLGSVRDMNAVAAWLCEANKGGSDEGYAAVTKRALKWRAGYGRPEDPDWFLSMRKTLEANMVMADLFPPGRVLWAIRDGDLDPSHRLSANTGTSESASDAENKVRLFDVLDVEKMFGQIIFARDMLSSHLPHQYDRVLHELL
ncbi:hypothetical protein ACEPAF_7002 [Sanghuangporus sanghuang]